MKKNILSGSALITALFIVALVSAIVASMMLRQQLSIQRTTLLINAAKLTAAADESDVWAKQIMKVYMGLKPNIRSQQKWPQSFKLRDANGVILQASLNAAQGKFNLNNLTKPQNLNSFVILLRTIDNKLSLNDARQLAAATVAWLSTKPNNFNAIYLKYNPPYQSARQPFVDVSELRLVAGFTADLYNKVAPYVIALPKPTPIDVNTAPVPVLMSIGKNISADDAQGVVQERNSTPFQTTNAFMSFSDLKNKGVNIGAISVTSDYFLLQTNATIQQQRLSLETLYQIVTDTNHKVVIEKLWQQGV